MGLCSNKKPITMSFVLLMLHKHRTMLCSVRKMTIHLSYVWLSLFLGKFIMEPYMLLALYVLLQESNLIALVSLFTL